MTNTKAYKTHCWRTRSAVTSSKTVVVFVKFAMLLKGAVKVVESG